MATTAGRPGTAGLLLLPERPIESVEEYLELGGGRGIQAARDAGPEVTIEEVTLAGLRGRGGGGFPTGRKWASIRGSGTGRRFVVANGAEGEPSTFKDRVLMRLDPYRVIEGAAIAALAVGAESVFVATKRTFTRELARLRSAAIELGAAGIIGDLQVTVVEGPEEYLFGEESALLEVVEGRDPLPRLLPPWQHGLFATVQTGWEAGSPEGGPSGSNPTLVNNVETLAAATHILAEGAAAFRRFGTEESPGTLLVTVVGDVARPGVHEVEMGTPFSDVLALCGGPVSGQRFKAALSGVSNPVLKAEDFDVPLTYEDMAARGTGLGAAGFAVYDERRDMVAVARAVSRFLAVESCGQCPPCKQGSLGITEHLTRIEEGVATDDDLGQLHSLLASVTDANRCYLGTEEQLVVSSLLRAFPEDFARRLEGRHRPARREHITLVSDISEDGTVTYDTRHRHKQPDWTYSVDLT